MSQTEKASRFAELMPHRGEQLVRELRFAARAEPLEEGCAQHGGRHRLVDRGGTGAQSFVPGSAVNVQFMVKDSKRYATTGGWGFADFKDGKPDDEALHKTCFPCHSPAKDPDFVYTRYSR